VDRSSAPLSPRTTKRVTAHRDPLGFGTPHNGAAPVAFMTRLGLGAGDREQQHYDSWLSLPAADPRLGLAILTCMDARLDINSALQIYTGDAHILRNAGGRVTPDVLRSLHLSVGLMNVREIGIVHHTDCGLEGVDNDTLAGRTGVTGIDFLPFQSVYDSLVADVNAVVHAGILPAQGIVWGAVYQLRARRVSLLQATVART
jgi:carbonic anhydrase